MNFNSVGISRVVSSWDLWSPVLDNRVLAWTSRQGACPEDFPFYLPAPGAARGHRDKVGGDNGKGRQNGKQKLQQGH